jgi:hypothetical protein
MASSKVLNMGSFVSFHLISLISLKTLHNIINLENNNCVRLQKLKIIKLEYDGKMKMSQDLVLFIKVHFNLLVYMHHFPLHAYFFLS